jgi:hypothetical protein
MDTSKITKHDAEMILGMGGFPGGVPSGGFYTKLMAAIGAADQSNQERLAQGFPGLVQAYRVFAYQDKGVERLYALTQGEDIHESD